LKHSDPYINALLTNDQRGVKEIYDTYLPRLEAILGKMGCNKDEAWEVFQESLIVILKKAQSPDFQLSSSFYTFLVSIAKFKWFNESKKKHNKNVTIDEIGTLSDKDDILESIMKLERFQLYQQKLKELDPVCQKLFELFFEKVSLRDIAVELGLNTENAAKQKKYKCQKKLIEKIKRDVIFKQLL
jgi:RNA polymerase sigma factor (sigma-70 family)